MRKLTGREIPCFSLKQLKLLSMDLELMLSVLAHSDVSLANILPKDYFKCMSMCIRRKKVTATVDAPKSVNAVAAMLHPWISELRGKHGQRQMTPRFFRSPNRSKCQLSDCH